MAKYVLLSFDDDEHADKFVESVQKMTGTLYMNKGDEEDPTSRVAALPAFIRAVFKKPTKFCGGPSCTGKKGGFTRGKKWGWWVCSNCGLPRKEWAKGDAWYTALGKNLLPVTQEAPEWRGSGVRGHRWDEEKKQWINVETGEPHLGRTTGP